MGAHFKALDEGVLEASLDSRYTQVGFNLVSVQVCIGFLREDNEARILCGGDSIIKTFFSRSVEIACTKQTLTTTNLFASIPLSITMATM